MCRLVGIVASEVTEFGLVLKEAPRSLAKLSEQHPDGWGIAAHGGPDASPPSTSRMASGWYLYKGMVSAGKDPRFASVAARSAGMTLVAHVRQKTVGPTRLENTHPFVQGPWVFAHNGTLTDHASLRAKVSPERASQIRGDTDSEVLFAYLLTRLDAASATIIRDRAVLHTATKVLAEVADELRQAKAGAFNFLLSDGASCFVHRFGRTLFLLERSPHDSSRDVMASAQFNESGRPWKPRKHAVFVASEHLTDEPWREVPEGAFFRIDRDPTPNVVWVETPAEGRERLLRA